MAITLPQVDEKTVIIKEDIKHKQALYLSTSHQIHERPEIGNEEFFASSFLPPS